jgi:hypothetical protein
LGIVKYEEAQDEHCLRYVLIKTLKPKRPNQIHNILNQLQIKPHKFSTDSEDITTFSRKESMLDNIHYKTIQSKKDSDSYIGWQVVKGLEADLNFTIKADGPRKREVTQRFAPVVAPVKRRRVRQDPDEPLNEPLSQPREEDVNIFRSAMGLMPDLQPMVQPEADPQPVVQPMVAPQPAADPQPMVAPQPAADPQPMIAPQPAADPQPVVQPMVAPQPVVQAIDIPDLNGGSVESMMFKVLNVVTSAKDETIAAKDAIIAAKDDIIAAKNETIRIFQSRLH